MRIALCASSTNPYVHHTCVSHTCIRQEHHHRCIKVYANLGQHCGNCIMSYSPFHFAWEKFHHCIALALQSYISRVHHSHGHRAYASRIIPFNLINSLSKNVLEQKTHLDIFSIKIHHQIEKLILSGLGSSLLCKILLYVSTRIIN